MTALNIIGIMCLGYFLGVNIGYFVRSMVRILEIRLSDIKPIKKTVEKKPIGFVCEAVKQEES